MSASSGDREADGSPGDVRRRPGCRAVRHRGERAPGRCARSRVATGAPRLTGLARAGRDNAGPVDRSTHDLGPSDDAPAHLLAPRSLGIRPDALQHRRSSAVSPPPTSDGRRPTPNDVDTAPGGRAKPCRGGSGRRKRRSDAGRRSRRRFGRVCRRAVGGGGRPPVFDTIFSCSVDAPEEATVDQRDRVARLRVRVRLGPPSCSATRSRTISVPSDTIRVPSGSIGHSPVGHRQVP